MWLFVMFDLPVKTKQQQHNAAVFRKILLDKGYEMFQYSVYIRCCRSTESAATHTNNIQQCIPEEGIVSILQITDKQFAEIIQLLGRKAKPLPHKPVQLELF